MGVQRGGVQRGDVHKGVQREGCAERGEVRGCKLPLLGLKLRAQRHHPAETGVWATEVTLPERLL